jgi:RHS repeat-associated protein
MSQAKPDEPVNRSEPRVVLLATDRSQSIIGEIVDGQAHTIAYSAYGEQSAQQIVETRLGFNGQLREADIGWYLLGNGYRAYNPRLMRFHSPDSWSPFRGGGLNAYMYCAGDPVNRVDPTGHILDLINFGISKLRKVAAFSLSADDIARNYAIRKLAAIKRQNAWSKLSTATGRNFQGDNKGSITESLLNAAVDVSTPPRFTGSPPTPNSPHVYPGGVAPKNNPLSYGFMYNPTTSTSSKIGVSTSTSTSTSAARRPHLRSSFDDPRTLHTGPDPQNYRPTIEHMRLLGADPPLRRDLVQRPPLPELPDEFPPIRGRTHAMDQQARARLGDVRALLARARAAQ